MINLQQLTLLRGHKTLFENVNLTFYDQHKVGLVGANGSGKSSLFALLTGKLEATSGEIDWTPNLRFAHVVQEITATDLSALDYVLLGHADYTRIQTAITQAETDEAFDQLADLHNQFAAVDGYRVPALAAQLLAGLGFDLKMQQQQVGDFSGGWRMRLNLAQALISPSDVLLLDEPTNHLDLPAIIWLEKWLQNYTGLLIVISHDRDFLDHLIDQVVHIEHKQIKQYSGDYSNFEKQRAQQLAIQQATYEKQQHKVKHMMKFVERFRYKASKARQAQSRLKAINRLEQVASVQVETPYEFEFLQPKTCPYPILTLDGVDLGYQQQCVLSGLDWQLVPGDRVALLGPNGAGKSTLIKALASQLQPLAGHIEISKQIQVGYFAQHQLEALVLDSTAFEHMQKLAPTEPGAKLRSYLGRFGFSGDLALIPVRHFSGGEKSRLALALLIWTRPNLLLLDEPTNHLDMAMRNALTLALQSFEGALVLVSHDRALLRNTVDQLWLLADGRLESFEGDLDDYQRWVLQYQGQAQSKSTVKAKGRNEKPNKKPNPLKLAQLEKQIADLEQQLKSVSAEINDPILYQQANTTQRDKLLKQQIRLQQQLEKLEQQWLDYHSL